MKRLVNLIVFAFLAFGGVGAYAQIPAEVTDVMNRCRAAMTNVAGLEYEMDMKAGMGPVALKMHFVVAKKGDLSRTRVVTKVLGMEITTESGFDGTNTWEVKDDTITITRGNTMKKGKEEMNLALDKQYRKAKMKQKDGFYEITFTEPKDSSVEAKSVTVKVSDKNYVLRELRSGARGAKLTMTLTKIHEGLHDNYFKLDLSKYPNAVVIKK